MNSPSPAQHNREMIAAKGMNSYVDLREIDNNTFDKQSKKNSMQLADQYEFGISYADTLKMWRQNFNAVSSQVVQMGFDEKFMRLWNLYLSYCEGAFRAGRINVGQYLIQAT